MNQTAKQTMNPSGVGDHFSLTDLLEARRRSIVIVEEAAAGCLPGLSEAEAHAHLKVLFRQHGIEKTWHPTKIRFGRNTMKTFRELSDPDVRLGNSDVFYFDIGPVWQGYEGDYGRTFAIGDQPEHRAIVRASEDVFRATAEQWRTQRLTGVELYDFAAAEASRRGYDLDPRMDGHRVGDFPHALHWKKDLGDLNGIPAAGLWILEIHLVDRNRRFAAFFEDLLVDEALPLGVDVRD